MNKTLYIIDGHAQIYAAYYAPLSGGGLSAPDGEPTKATLIFTTMLLKLLKERRPDLLVVAMDAPGPTFRHEQYKEYKANRPPIPEDLPTQIQRIDQILEAMRIPVFRSPGYEADDLIGTLANRAVQEGYQVVICSKDKDLEQLLGPMVKMYDPRSDQEVTVESLLNDKGITPEQVIDTLALVGDASDNIPGVPDVGPKTALQWIQQYGSLDNLLAHAADVKGKRGDNLRANADLARLSRQLATINCQVPMQFAWEDMAVKVADRAALEKLFLQLDFRRLLGQLNVIAPATAGAEVTGPTESPVSVPASLFDMAPPVSSSATYHLVDTLPAFEGFLEQLRQQRAFAVDTETTSSNPVAAVLVGLSFSWEPGVGYYLPVKAPLGQQSLLKEGVIKALGPILADPNVKKTGQNIKYDLIVLRRAGFEVAGVDFDTMVASYILDSSRMRHNLDSLALDYLGHETIKLESLLGKGKNMLTFDMVDTRLAADYSGEDSEVTWRLRQCFEQRLVDPELRRLFETVEMPLVEVLAAMELHGVAIDVPCLRKMGNELGKRLGELSDEIQKQAGCSFNVDSPKQLSDVLFNKLGLPSVKKTQTGDSTDQEVLESLRWQHPVAELMLEYRQLSKLQNTYVEKLPTMIHPQTDRIHASFNQTVTATGRLSSSDPNLQNIPVRTELGQEIRRAFVAQKTDDTLLAADYSQIELRLLAHFSRDQALREAFASGQDIHRFVAAQVYGVPLEEVTSAQRSKAKAVNFGIIYGQTPYGLSRGIGVSVEEAKRFIDDYFARYPAISTFMESTLQQARQEGGVRTILGRRRMIDGLNSKNVSQRKLAERMAINTVIQGSAADMIKVAMVNLHRRILRENLPLKMILQVHDELVFELPRAAVETYSPIIEHEMITAIPVEVPIVVDIGAAPNWLECK